MHPVHAAQPLTDRLQEGVELFADGTFRGGVQGAHKFQWFRKPPQVSDPIHRCLSLSQLTVQVPGDVEAQFAHIGDAVERTYVPGPPDVGCTLRVTCIPTAKNGDKGFEIEAASADSIDAGMPRILDLKIQGGPAHSGVLEVQAEYFGGEEGAPGTAGGSIIQWYRSYSLNEFQGPWLPIARATQPTYQPSIDDVAARVMCKYLPVRKDGMRGPLAQAEAQQLEATPPARHGQLTLAVESGVSKDPEHLS